MTKAYRRLLRRLVPLATAGMIFQAAGGCQFDATETVNGVVTSVANQLISSLVFDLFGVTTAP